MFLCLCRPRLKNGNVFFPSRIAFFFLLFCHNNKKKLAPYNEGSGIYVKPFSGRIDTCRADVWAAWGTTSLRSSRSFFFVFFSPVALQRRPSSPWWKKDLPDATKDQQEGRKSLNFILSHPLLLWKLVVLWPCGSPKATPTAESDPPLILVRGLVIGSFNLGDGWALFFFTAYSNLVKHYWLMTSFIPHRKSGHRKKKSPTT